MAINLKADVESRLTELHQQREQLTAIDAEIEQLELIKAVLEGKGLPKTAKRSSNGKGRNVSPEGTKLRTLKMQLARATKKKDKAEITRLKGEIEDAQKAYEKMKGWVTVKGSAA